MASGPTLDAVRRALAALRPATADAGPGERRAAVAMALRQTARGAELLFIHRAEHPRDPWSGQMGFPGGRVESDDASPLAAAIRETREELALDLQRDATLLGPLSEVRTHLSHGPAPRLVSPFLFELLADAPLSPNHEVQAAVWVPLAFLADRANRSSMTWVRRGVPLPFPCYRYEGRVIWGLSLRMLDELLDLL